MARTPPRDQPCLFREFPALARKVPWMALGSFPTPVHELADLSRHMRGGESIWIKRDDLSGDLYGGNKVRKLEFLIADVLGRRKERILAYGAAGSNWAVACLVYGALLGIPTDLLLFRKPTTEHGRLNLEVDRKLAARLHECRTLLGLPVRLALDLLRNVGRSVYLAPPGGTSVRSTLGYVDAAFELRDQIVSGLLPRPDLIFVPLGTGGTAAGLVAGLQAAAIPSRVMAVRVVDRMVGNAVRVWRLAGRTRRLMERLGAAPLPARLARRSFRILHGFAGKGYGIASREAEAARELVGEVEGIELDSTYTAKAMAGMIGYVRKFPVRGRTLLFWNTSNSRSLGDVEGRLEELAGTPGARRQAERR